MRHHTARQKGEGGGWHYVSMSREGGYPLGYCRDHGPHPTELEARECYSRWQRDNIRLDVQTSNWCSCEAEGCPNPTKEGADIRGDGYHHAMLCPDHLNVQDAARAMGLLGPAGDAWVS